MYNNTFHKLFFSKNLKLEFSAYMYQKGLIENLADVSLGIFLYIPSHYTTVFMKCSLRDHRLMIMS